jgi:GNAT superfamily N-acetyltransferase
MADQYSIEVVSTDDILHLRMAVLRDGTPSQDPRYPEDEHHDSVHLALRIDGDIVGTSTWLARPWPHEPQSPATQLRGMAIAAPLQSRGLGALLLQAGIDRARERGDDYIWARARDTALRFYERNGFTVVGDAFNDDATGMSHHLVMTTIFNASHKS